MALDMNKNMTETQEETLFIKYEINDMEHS